MSERYIISEQWAAFEIDRIQRIETQLKVGWKYKIEIINGTECIIIETPADHLVLYDFQLPRPPAYHGFIWIPGSSMGYWQDVEEAIQIKLITQQQYEWAIEDAQQHKEQDNACTHEETRTE